MREALDMNCAIDIRGVAAFLSLCVILLFGANPDLQAADKRQIARGEYLMRAGDCIDCHTAPGGAPFAGGRSMSTPFGSITTPNITSDKETGIGSWSDEDFYRALHDGIGKDGQLLYPVFPFNWYTKVTRADVMALRAYLATVPPVHAERHVDTLEFPFSVRASLAVWRKLYFKPGQYHNDPHKSAQWNRGAYLVLGLGHCGECHTQRNALGAQKKAEALQGGAIEGWYAPNITSDMQKGIGGWSEAQLVTYLKTGASPDKGVAVGPMGEVVEASLKYLSDADLRAIVTYLKQTAPEAHTQTAVALPSPGSSQSGGALYLDYCASCHQVDGRGIKGAVPALAGNGLVQAERPNDVMAAIVGGVPARGASPIMPAFGADLSDQDVAALTDYVRSAWGNKALANADIATVAQIRGLVSVPLADTSGNCRPMKDTALAHELEQPNNGVAPLLDQISDDNVDQKARAAVAAVKKVDPQLQRAQAVNDLSSALCQRLWSRQGLTPVQKRDLYYRFGRVVYQQLGGTG
jgi:mono/diheme cytochrome c family protein